MAHHESVEGVIERARRLGLHVAHLAAERIGHTVLRKAQSDALCHVRHRDLGCQLVVRIVNALQRRANPRGQLVQLLRRDTVVYAVNRLDDDLIDVYLRELVFVAQTGDAALDLVIGHVETAALAISDLHV